MPHFPMPHFPMPHFPMPHFPMPHFPMPHFPMPHFPMPHSPMPHFPMAHSGARPTGPRIARPDDRLRREPANPEIGLRSFSSHRDSGSGPFRPARNDGIAVTPPKMIRDEQ